MALAQLPSAAVEGITASPVEIEVDVATGLPGFTVVGLADKAVEESRERVRSAIKHSGYSFPLSRITVHLAPSDKRKSGIHFDLPIALTILLADEQLAVTERLSSTMFIGGLTLNGDLQNCPGVLVLVEWAKEQGYQSVVVPTSSYHEARLIDGIEIVPLKTLTAVIDYLLNDFRPELPRQSKAKIDDQTAGDWLQIQGQAQAKRAALIAAAGGHNLLLEGPPGAGKTLIAKGMRALLPPLTHPEQIEVIKLHSVAGALNRSKTVDAINRPFRSPHHTTSHIAVVGGGPSARPGEISLAHRGILFMDELPEFPRSVIESLRQPLEDGEIFVTRVAQTSHYPAQFILVATMNPCPCGWFGSAQKECKCSPYEISHYRKKVSGPIIDRIDLCLKIPAVTLDELRGRKRDQVELDQYRQMVSDARKLQLKRNNGRLNGDVQSRNVDEICKLNDEAEKLIERATQKLVLTGRGYHKLLKVARTIADLGGQDTVGSAAVAEALQYRFNDND